MRNCVVICQPFMKQLVQIENIWRQQNECDLKIEISIGNNGKQCGKGENTGYRHFLLFHQCLY